jgi:hypothetical protein
MARGRVFTLTERATDLEQLHEKLGSGLATIFGQLIHANSSYPGDGRVVSAKMQPAR